jgi:hypothetical protein
MLTWSAKAFGGGGGVNPGAEGNSAVNTALAPSLAVPDAKVFVRETPPYDCTGGSTHCPLPGWMLIEARGLPPRGNWNGTTLRTFLGDLEVDLIHADQPRRQSGVLVCPVLKWDLVFSTVRECKHIGKITEPDGCAEPY